MINDEKPSLEELAHHGVKGMKWGVRRELKRKAKKNFGAYSQQIHARSNSLTWEISESEYKHLSTKPIKLGKDFLRIGDGSGNLRDIAYVTTNEVDHNRYKAFIGPNKTGNINKGKFELKLKTAKEAISPSEKERVDAYIDTLKNKKITDTAGSHEVHTGREWAAGAEGSASFNSVKALSDRELGLQTYRQFAQSQHQNTPIHSAYFDTLRKRGYTAVVDDADRGIISDIPVILFPKESGTRVIEIKPVDADELLRSKASVKLLK